ncbi:hypothetical protein BN938_1056 [Mucinivorans hirudinis]|uniref:Uncharacterized protein n=1 Tax=Mucinivorans hirudinis TaxID=1433126 RepID=A0A060R7G9_9BACT|nr:hypothetical protein BN938_1056 [Mucinivorans hirudinis]
MKSGILNLLMLEKGEVLAEIRTHKKYSDILNRICHELFFAKL